MKKFLMLAVFLSIFCYTAESALLPGLRKSASTTKVVKDGSESTATISNNLNNTTNKSGSSDTQATSLANLPNGKAYIGVNSYLSLREEPFGRTGSRLYNNEEVVIVNRDGDWYEIESEKGSGWVYAKCVFDSPNNNPNGSDPDKTTNDEKDEEDDDDNSSKGDGTYYYFTFDNPGEYRFTFISESEDSDESDNSNNTDLKETTTTDTKASNSNNTKNKNTKTKTAKTKSTNKSTKTTTAKSNKSDSKNNNSIDKDNHLKAAQVWVDIVFNEILKNKCYHKPPKASSFEEIKKKKRISCTKSSSIVFQQAGMIPKGKIVGHTPNGRRGHSNESFEKALKKSVTNAKYLLKDSCDIVMVMKKYKDCPKWLQTKGIYYIQESNACVSAGNGRIYSCNQTNKRYTKRSMFYRKSGYCMTRPILFAFVPRTNGKSNVPKNCGFRHKAAWGKGTSKIVSVK